MKFLSDLKKYLPHLSKGYKNFYIMFAFIFLVWMLFFDSNDFISQYRMSKAESNMRKEKVYFEEKIEEVKEERQALFSDPAKLEKFARENYKMKKSTEDVFIVVEE
ncbi:MAG: septum formation initiator family protein [Cytophagaceae bacterium]